MTRWAAAVVAIWACGCSEPLPAPAPQTRTVIKPAVSWQGSGPRTLDFVSESGHFRITWTAKGAGTFRLTVHSGVSGRPLREIVSQRGDGKGSALFEDDPRPYHFMIESADVEWSVSAEEIVTVVAPRTAESH